MRCYEVQSVKFNRRRQVLAPVSHSRKFGVCPARCMMPRLIATLFMRDYDNGILSVSPG